MARCAAAHDDHIRHLYAAPPRLGFGPAKGPVSCCIKESVQDLNFRLCKTYANRVGDKSVKKLSSRPQRWRRTAVLIKS